MIMIGRGSMEKKKPTLKELLARHNIAFTHFYEYCMEVPTEDINMMYNHHTCTRTGILKMIAFINKQAGTAYTPEDVYIAKMY
jgi:hypothetical protein